MARKLITVVGLIVGTSLSTLATKLMIADIEMLEPSQLGRKKSMVALVSGPIGTLFVLIKWLGVM